MNTDLLEIQPQELRFIFELKKQSSCSVRLVNKSNHHVAFKVKTTSPKKYCVRPNTGVIKPKSACDFTVTMQAQKVAPPDLICKDKFLVQCTNVPAGTEDEDISTVTFAKEDGKRVQEKRLRVILVSPPNSPVLSPINGTLKQVQAYEPRELKDQVANEKQNLSSYPKVTEYVEESKMEISEDQEPKRNAESSIIEELKLVKDGDEMKSKVKDTVELKLANDVDEMKSKVKDTVELKLANDVDEMKSKLKELESKLGEAEVAISKLTYEKGLTTQEREKLRQELELLVRSKKGVTRRVQVGFPLLFVYMVALISLFLGYQLHR